MRVSRCVVPVTAALLLGAAVAACRDVGEPFRPADDEPVTSPRVRRLTYAGGDDRSPSWSANGDTIFYTSSSWEGNPVAPGTILAIPADGVGYARPALHGVQNGPAARNWLTSLAIAPAAETVAFIRVAPLQPAAPCEGSLLCTGDDEDLPSVGLTGVEVHVRARDAIGGLPEDSILPLAIAGRAAVHDPSVPGGLLTISEYHPFQRQFAVDGQPFFRPSWRPDGAELVVSDGLHLYRWVPGAAEPTRIPGTEDGTMPAWSPTGEWIAYTRTTRIASAVLSCEYWWDDAARCAERRIMHYAGPPQIMLVQPDGFSELELGPGSGTDPAWSPDGRHVYSSTTVAGYPMLARIDIETRVVELITGTEGGFEPAISPDGQRIAFARRGNAGYDIWIVDLP